jgi:hypothetical protein
MMNMKNIQSIFRKPRKWLLILLLGGMSFGSLAFVNNYFELSKNIEIFTALYREVNTYYVDEIDPAKFMRTGIDAMLKSLDPYGDTVGNCLQVSNGSRIELQGLLVRFPYLCTISRHNAGHPVVQARSPQRRCEPRQQAVRCGVPGC